MKSPAEQEVIYRNYWYEIELNTNNNVSNFIRNYLTIKQRSATKQNQIYLDFKKYTKIIPDIATLLDDLLKFSKYYNIIISQTAIEPKIDIALEQLNKLEVTAIYPFLLEMLDDYFANLLNLAQLLNCLNIIQSFLTRRMLCNLSTNKLSRIFLRLGKEIKDCPHLKNYSYDTVLGHILVSYKMNEFPTDKMVKDSLIFRNIYDMAARYKSYLFNMLETFGNKERLDMSNAHLSIEHIMPKKLNDVWKQELGENYKEVHYTYLNTLGNLTLTGYNSKLSNCSFKDKKNMCNGYKDSLVYLNKYLANLDTWDEAQILARTAHLTDRILTIWQYPLQLAEVFNVELIYSLDEEGFEQAKITHFKTIDMPTPVPTSDWADCIYKLCTLLYDKNPIVMINLVASETFKNRFSSGKRKSYNKEIADSHIFLKCQSNTSAKLQFLRELLPHFDLEAKDIDFYVRKSEKLD